MSTRDPIFDYAQPENYPLQEAAISDLFAENLERIEIMGDQARLVFWRWRYEAGKWRRLALEWAIVVPVRSLALLTECYPNAPIIKPPTAADRMN